MERIKAIKNSNYTVINNTCIKDTRLSLKAKGLFTMVMSLPETWDFTVQGFAKLSLDKTTAIYSAINELIEFGYCKRHYLYENGKRCGVEYIFNETPENLNLENLNLENQIQLNTNSNKVKKENISASLVLENEEERILRRTTEVIDYITNNRLRISDYMSKLSSYKDEDLIKEYVSTCDLNKGNGYLLQGFSFFLQNKIKYETEKTKKKKEATTKKKGAAVVKKAPQWNTPEYIAMFEAKPNEKPENLLQKFKQREL